MRSPVIALLTDYGDQDFFAALKVKPGARVEISLKSRRT
jgi:hypothetical protein